jgi:hypothetical protein
MKLRAQAYVKININPDAYGMSVAYRRMEISYFFFSETRKTGCDSHNINYYIQRNDF